MAQRRNGNVETASDTDSDRGSAMDCLPAARRILLPNFATPNRKAPTTRSNTPASSRRQATPYSRVPKFPPSSANGISNNLRIAKVADPIGVYCRVRPWGDSDEERCVKILDDGKQIVLTPPETSGAWKLGVAKEGTYSFQQVFGPNVEQQVVQETIALPLVEDVLKGKNALLFAYGVTGSGKTYTMSGNSNEGGIMPRSFDVIFNSISNHQARKYVFKPDKMNMFDVQSKADAMLDKQKEIQAVIKTPRTRNGQARFVQGTSSDTEMAAGRAKDPTVLPVVQDDYLYAVFVTYVEIYNNFVYDLLDDSCIDDRTKKFNLPSKMLREDANRNVYVHGGTEVEVTSSEEAFEVFLRGQRRRKQAHTCLNTESSRSHAIFNIRIVQAPLDANGEEVMDDNSDKNAPVISQLSLVDLAGSERYGRTGATGDRLKEAGNINNSLMTLRKCMDILRENQQTGSSKLVPYRDSKLTHYLKNYFEGEGRVRMIICLNPRNDDYDENIHVMSFAELTQEVQVIRPQERKPDPALTPGRRKANEIFKEARRRIVEDINIDENQIPTDVNMVFGLGPPLPHCQMTKSDEEELITNLRRALEMRIKGRAELAKILNDKRHNFRIRLVDVERDLETMRVENATLKYRVDQVLSEKESTETVLKSLQVEKTEQELRGDELERENRALKDELDNCKMEYRQLELLHLKDRDRLKSDLDRQFELHELKTDRELQRKEAKLKATFKNKEKTLDAVRQLIGSENTETRHSRSRRRSRSESLSTTSASESDVPVVYSSRTPMTTRSRVISAPHLLTDRSPQKTFSGAITNPRHNRALSSDRDTWLEHTPGQPVKSGTVMQPMMKKKKSVNQLTNADEIINKGKYCLNTQETDSVGGLETRLYKGDVLPSRSGGAQVVFNDVEILKQVSPTGVDCSPSRKRPSSAALHSLPGTPLKGAFLGTYDEVDENGQTLAERCATGIGYQNPNRTSKRSRQH